MFVKLPPLAEGSMRTQGERPVTGWGAAAIPGWAERGKNAVALTQRPAQDHLMMQRVIGWNFRSIQTGIHHERPPAIAQRMR